MRKVLSLSGLALSVAAAMLVALPVQAETTASATPTSANASTSDDAADVGSFQRVETEVTREGDGNVKVSKTQYEVKEDGSVRVTEAKITLSQDEFAKATAGDNPETANETDVNATNSGEHADMTSNDGEHADVTNNGSKGTDDEVRISSEQLKTLEDLAAGGNVYYMSVLGALYFSGDYGVKKDYAKAKTYLEKAADNGDTDSLLLLANMYAKGLGVQENLQKGMELLMSAAEKGNKSAQETLMYIHEMYGEPDSDKGTEK